MLPILSDFYPHARDFFIKLQITQENLEDFTNVPILLPVKSRLLARYFSARMFSYRLSLSDVFTELL